MKNHRLLFAGLVILGAGQVIACGEQVVVRETEARCGNAQVETGEACDDGNGVSVSQQKTGNGCQRSYIDNNGDYQTVGGDGNSQLPYVLTYTN